MKTSQSLAISQKVDIVCSRNVKYDFSSSFLQAMDKATLYIDTDGNQTPEITEKTNEQSGQSTASKLRNTVILSGGMILGLLSGNADAQIQELGTIDDGARNSWLLKDTGQEIVYWDEISPDQQSFAIFRINTEDPEDWQDDNTTIFGTANSEIIVDDIGNPSEIIETEVDGRQARKVHFDQLAPGKYVFQTKINASHPDNPQGIDTWTTRLFVEVAEDGNMQVFKIEGWNGFDTDQFWGNRIGEDKDAIEFAEQSGMGGEIQISIPVSTIADGSTDKTLDMDQWRQTQAKLIFTLNDGTTITKSAEDIEYDMDNNRLITSIHQESGQYIVSIGTQHAGVEDIMVTGPQLSVMEQVLANSIKLYPNPVRQGGVLQLQLPEGINKLHIPYSVINMAGQEVLYGQFDETIAVTAPVAQGVYILKF